MTTTDDLPDLTGLVDRWRQRLNGAADEVEAANLEFSAALTDARVTHRLSWSRLAEAAGVPRTTVRRHVEKWQCR